MRVRQGAVILGAAVLAVSGLTATATTATAASARPVSCTGALDTGTYAAVTVPSGECRVADGAHVTVLGNVTVAPGASFNASTHSALAVGGNVTAGAGAFVQLGCTDAHPCDDGQPGTPGADHVRGNVTLHQVYDAAVNGVTIDGNLTSNGGGAGLATDQFIPFSVKDDVIHGNVVVSGLTTTWFGVIRSEVGGNVVLTDITLADPDGNEVVNNTIGRNLVCHGDSPTPQLGDAVEGAPPGYGPNTLGGRGVGQCASLPTT
jgi:hypothetical protein